jgi:hypothetical protein
MNAREGIERSRDPPPYWGKKMAKEKGGFV